MVDFSEEADKVALELLGKNLVRNVDGKLMKARIVETEAYFDERDPASRACQNGDIRDTMLMEAGTLLVYGVHNSWLVNFVTGEKGKAQAVLIRALEPLNFSGKCNGPGLLTKRLGIGKDLHKCRIGDQIWIEDPGNFIKDMESETQISEISHSSVLEDTKERNNFEIIKSFRIGVSNDLDIPLRFYIKDNGWVSRR